MKNNFSNKSVSVFYKVVAAAVQQVEPQHRKAGSQVNVHFWFDDIITIQQSKEEKHPTSWIYVEKMLSLWRKQCGFDGHVGSEQSPHLSLRGLWARSWELCVWVRPPTRRCHRGSVCPGCRSPPHPSWALRWTRAPRLPFPLLQLPPASRDASLLSASRVRLQAQMEGWWRGEYSL